MRAIILAGGRGIRLRPLTVYTPKPVVPLLNRPFLLFQLDTLKRAGVSAATFCLSYQPNKIEDVLATQPGLGIDVDFVTEPTPLGTAGAYKAAIGDTNEASIVLNGDILADIDLSKVIAFHKKNKAAATIVLTSVEDASAYGLVEIDEGNRVTAFHEKPTHTPAEGAKPSLINAGIYVIEKEAAALIPTGENASFEYKVFPEILERGLPFYAYVMEDKYWLDIGNPAGYLKANLDALGGAIPSIGGEQHRAESEISTTAIIDSATALGSGCIIKPNVTIEHSVIGEGVHIEEKAAIKDSVIWPYTRIAGSAEVTGAVIGRGCHVGKNAVVRPGTVLGDKAVVPDYSVA